MLRGGDPESAAVIASTDCRIRRRQPTPITAQAECSPMVYRSMGHQYSMRMNYDCCSGQTSEEGGLFMPFMRESSKELAARTGVPWGRVKTRLRKILFGRCSSTWYADTLCGNPSGMRSGRIWPVLRKWHCSIMRAVRKTSPRLCVARFPWHGHPQSSNRTLRTILALATCIPGRMPGIRTVSVSGTRSAAVLAPASELVVARVSPSIEARGPRRQALPGIAGGRAPGIVARRCGLGAADI